MPAYWQYSNAIFGTQSTVNGSAHDYQFAPANGSTWSWSGDTTSFVAVEGNSAGTLFNGDSITNEEVDPDERFDGAWPQWVTIDGTDRQVIWDYTFEITSGGTTYRVAVIDVDLNNDNDVEDAGEDGYYLVFPDGVPPAGGNYTVGNIVENDASTPHAGLGGTAVCFCAGTKVLTERGEVPIETLRTGDRVWTLDHGLQPLLWIGRRTVPAVGRMAPVRFATGAIGNTRPLTVSPNHRVLIEHWRADLMFGVPEVLVRAIDLVNGDTITRVPGGEVTYFHLLLDGHEILRADGALSESLYPSANALEMAGPEAAEEILTLFPEIATRLSPKARTSLKAREAVALFA